MRPALLTRRASRTLRHESRKARKGRTTPRTERLRGQRRNEVWLAATVQGQQAHRKLKAEATRRAPRQPDRSRTGSEDRAATTILSASRLAGTRRVRLAPPVPKATAPCRFAASSAVALSPRRARPGREANREPDLDPRNSRTLPLPARPVAPTGQDCGVACGRPLERPPMRSPRPSMVAGYLPRGGRRSCVASITRRAAAASC